MTKKKSEPKTVRDRAFYQAIGKKGGQKTLERHGLDHFAKMGELGGQALLEERGTDYYRAIGRIRHAKDEAPDAAS